MGNWRGQFSFHSTGDFITHFNVEIWIFRKISLNIYYYFTLYIIFLNLNRKSCPHYN